MPAQSPARGHRGHRGWGGHLGRRSLRRGSGAGNAFRRAFKGRIDHFVSRRTPVALPQHGLHVGALVVSGTDHHREPLGQDPHRLAVGHLALHDAPAGDLAPGLRQCLNLVGLSAQGSAP